MNEPYRLSVLVAKVLANVRWPGVAMAVVVFGTVRHWWSKEEGDAALAIVLALFPVAAGVAASSDWKGYREAVKNEGA